MGRRRAGDTAPKRRVTNKSLRSPVKGLAGESLNLHKHSSTASATLTEQHLASEDELSTSPALIPSCYIDCENASLSVC